MFIRKKRIKGKDYAYLVRNTWTRRGARQKVSQYLGKVHILEQQHALSFEAFLQQLGIAYVDYVATIHPQRFIHHIVGYELHKHGFHHVQGTVWASEDLVVDLEKATVTSTTPHSASVVLQLNNDFLCDATLQALNQFTPMADEQQTAVSLAKAFVKAGIALNPTLYVDVYEKFQHLYQTNQQSTQQKGVQEKSVP